MNSSDRRDAERLADELRDGARIIQNLLDTIDEQEKETEKLKRKYGEDE